MKNSRLLLRNYLDSSATPIPRSKKSLNCRLCQSDSFDGSMCSREKITHLSIFDQEVFLLRGIFEWSDDSTPRCECSVCKSTGKHPPKPSLTSHSLYIPTASWPSPKKKKIKSPHPRLVQRSYKTVDGITTLEFQEEGSWMVEKEKDLAPGGGTWTTRM